ncbi:hypothetical protein BAE44_0026240 [Dichanthelium oligosanthes]|uniref:Uncharacterized protein n=1 Tax=Dichanthelium oligosanthes TaxID=888268 RepID=A0A1E5UIN4_9POAL|nr:hypothetical protein BAE44_0026240 [Dichanthelium oligosanthes]
MAGTGGTPFLLSPATMHAATPSSAVSDVEAAGAIDGAQHRAGKAAPAPDAGAAFVLESKGIRTHLIVYLGSIIHLTDVTVASAAG